MPTSVASPPTLVDHIASTLSEMILGDADRFQPGDRLRIAPLCALFNSSPTPVKEALRQLESEGLVVIEPRRGARVATMSQRDFEEIFELRVELELMAIRLMERDPDQVANDQFEAVISSMECAVENARPIDYHQLDCTFHSLVVDLGGNSRLSGFYGNLMTQYRIRPAYMSTTVPGMNQSLREHRGIAEALQSRDLARAELLVDQHWRHARLRAESDGSPVDKEVVGEPSEIATSVEGPASRN